MDRNVFVKALWLAKQQRRITADDYLIARAMLRMASRNGVLWPSLQTLAAATGACVRTAQRAITRLSAAYLLIWTRRKCAWNRNETNLYTLSVPAYPQVIPATRVVRKKESIFFESSTDSLSYGSEPPTIAPEYHALLLAKWGLAEAVE